LHLPMCCDFLTSSLPNPILSDPAELQTYVEKTNAKVTNYKNRFNSGEFGF